MLHVIRKKGFTLIEVIVVVGVLSLVMPALFSIIFSILQQQVKVYRLAEVKRQGDYVLSTVEHIIRNYATGIYTDQYLTPNNVRCSSTADPYSSVGGTDFYFKDKYSYWLRFYTPAGTYNVSSQSARVNSLILTTNRVRIENFTIACSRAGRYSPPIVSISFDICYNNNKICTDPHSRAEETASMKYQSKIKLRSY